MWGFRGRVDGVGVFGFGTEGKMIDAIYALMRKDPPAPGGVLFWLLLGEKGMYVRKCKLFFEEGGRSRLCKIDLGGLMKRWNTFISWIQWISVRWARQSIIQDRLDA